MEKLLSIFLFMTWIITQGQSVFPIKISENKRYFVTRQGNPFLYHADTGWGIFTKYEGLFFGVHLWNK